MTSSDFYLFFLFLFAISLISLSFVLGNIRFLWDKGLLRFSPFVCVGLVMATPYVFPQNTFLVECSIMTGIFFFFIALTLDGLLYKKMMK